MFLGFSGPGGGWITVEGYPVCVQPSHTPAASPPILTYYRKALPAQARDLLFYLHMVYGWEASHRLADLLDELHVDPGPNQERWGDDPE